MNNELFHQEKSDTIKWIIAFTLIAVLIVGVIAAIFIGLNKPETKDTPPIEQEQTENNLLIMPDEMNGVSLSMKAMSATDNGVNALAENSDSLTATIQPASAMQRAVWSVAWKNSSSAWATGKTVTDYVTVTPAEEGALTATLSCVKPFSEQVVLTVNAAANTSKSATCTVDYQQRLNVSNFSLGGSALSGDSSNFKAQLSKVHRIEIDYSYTDGTIPYLGKVGEYNEFICAGVAFTDEFISAYNKLNGTLADISRKMARHNVSSEYAHTRDVDFGDSAYGGTVFYELGIGEFTDEKIAAIRAAVNEVGEENVFKVGIFKTESAITSTYVECDTWFKFGLDMNSVYMATESITVNESGVVF